MKLAMLNISFVTFFAHIYQNVAWWHQKYAYYLKYTIFICKLSCWKAKQTLPHILLLSHLMYISALKEIHLHPSCFLCHQKSFLKKQKKRTVDFVPTAYIGRDLVTASMGSRNDSSEKKTSYSLCVSAPGGAFVPEP